VLYIERIYANLEKRLKLVHMYWL